MVDSITGTSKSYTGSASITHVLVDVLFPIHCL